MGENLKYLLYRAGPAGGGLAVRRRGRRCKVKDQWIGWKDRERAAGFHRLTNNTRFLIPVGAGSRAGSWGWSRVSRRGEEACQVGHGIELVETFVDRGFAWGCRGQQRVEVGWRRPWGIRIVPRKAGVCLPPEPAGAPGCAKGWRRRTRCFAPTDGQTPKGCLLSLRQRSCSPKPKPGQKSRPSKLKFRKAFDATWSTRTLHKQCLCSRSEKIDPRELRRGLPKPPRRRGTTGGNARGSPPEAEEEKPGNRGPAARRTRRTPSPTARPWWFSRAFAAPPD